MTLKVVILMVFVVVVGLITGFNNNNYSAIGLDVIPPSEPMRLPVQNLPYNTTTTPNQPKSVPRTTVRTIDPAGIFTKNEYFRNETTGEYRLEIEFADGNRRFEFGEFDTLPDNKTAFVIRGLFTYIEEDVMKNVLYKIDPEKGFMTFEDPLSQTVDFGTDGVETPCDPNMRFQSRCIDQKLINILLG